MKKILFFIFTIFLVSGQVSIAQKDNKVKDISTPGTKWVDSVYSSLSLDQKIGQLFMVAAYSGGEKYNRTAIEKLIANNYIGGLIFMQGTPEAQAEQTNAFQASSKVPLMIAMDAEWGLGMRLKTVDDFPRQIMLGAMRDSSLVYKMGQAIAKQCRRLGVHVNFAPVLDINNNPNNPVINFRSFGENKYNVVKYATQYMRGMQDNGVMACAKHFPGHGNTAVDSHKDLPSIDGTATELENTELYPFRELINKGIMSIMIAHLQVPALDNTPNLPTTLSKKVVTDLLKTKYNYKGLVFTDALNMKGVTKYYKPGEVDRNAFVAGNDVLLFSEDVPTGVAKIKEALKNKIITEARIEESVKKILLAKYIFGLNKVQKIDVTNITNDLNAVTSSIRTQVAKEAITLLNDQYNLIDKVSKNPSNKVAYVSIGTKDKPAMAAAMAARGVTEYYNLDDANSSVINKLKSYNAVIIGVQGIALYPGTNFGISAQDVNTINNLQANNNTILVLFGNPYSAKYFCNGKCVMIAYDDKTETQNVAADICTGNLRPRGKLPVTVCPNFKQGNGIVSIKNELGEPNNLNPFSETEIYTIKKKDSTQLNLNNQGYNLPVNLTCCVNPSVIGADNSKLDKIDVLIENAIAKGAFPGARILIAKDGKVFYNKSFGTTSYDHARKVDDLTLYDIASVTKVAATTLCLMKLYDQGKLDLNKTLGDYLPVTLNTDKSSMQIKDIMMHQAGLKSWIPFYKETVDSNKLPLKEIYNNTLKDPYTIKVANNLYMNKHWTDTMWQRIFASPVGARTYEYSDLDFIFLQKVIEKITGTTFEKYVDAMFYKPLGLNNIGFNPLNKKRALGNIAPTEVDDYFRWQTVQGTVHDMAAAMFGGVSGHAGVFSTADDLSVIMQMLLNNGMYNGKRFFSKTTVDLFTDYHSNSRRGYGWDKPERTSKSNPCADNCSFETFGHQGFTGTCVWADPKYNLQFIFLSNRTYPLQSNKLINSMNIRSRAQELAYEALGIASKR
jgi:beta-N-acetylhexosaminidase